MASKVYFMSDRASSPETGLVPKMLAVFHAAGLEQLIKPGDIVAIKTHCGEYNNTGYLRPVFARALADRIKELGGRPFVTDTTTLPYSPYSGRCTALDELLTAERNGFNQLSLGCPFIVADGFIGKDDVRVDLPEGFILKEQYVAHALALADVVIVLSHFKGHGVGTIGGAIKNIGIGAASQRGKYNVHLGGHPVHGLSACYYYPQLCLGKSGCAQWEMCEQSCPYGLIHVSEAGAEFKRDGCTGCYGCAFFMRACGVLTFPEECSDMTNAAIADSALALVKAVGKENVGFINMAVDVTPLCDCMGFTDRPIVPNLGVMASKDPVAIDQACVDLSIQVEGIPGSAAEDKGVLAAGVEKFTTASSGRCCSEDVQINTGALNSLGSREYELVEVAPLPRERCLFQWDRRPASVRLARLYAKDAVYPADGFRRLQDAPLEKVR